MKLAAIVVVAGSFLLGCGGGAMDANTTEPVVASSQQGICEGWPNPNCTAKCGGTWYYVGTYPSIGYGECTAAGDNLCLYWFGVHSSGACWSR